MRDYAKVSPTFWTGTTGKALRRGMEPHGRGIEAVVVALYLMTAPGSNMLGLYYQPVLYMAHETGLGPEGASKGLKACIDAGFCRFDEATEMVWVIEMASYQIAEELKATDKRCAGIQKDYDALPNCPFLGDFYDRYAGCFHLTKKRENAAASEAPYQAPSKPHRSKEQEKEQEKEGKKEGASKTASLDLGFVLPNWIPEASWNGYVEMRVKTKKTMTDRARDLVVAELDRQRQAGHDVGAILDKSTKNNWTDVYAPKPGDMRGMPPSSDDLYRGAR